MSGVQILANILLKRQISHSLVFSVCEGPEILCWLLPVESLCDRRGKKERLLFLCSLIHAQIWEITSFLALNISSQQLFVLYLK